MTNNNITNATIVLEFKDDIFHYPVVWEGEGFLGCDELGDKIFSSTNNKFQENLRQSFPEISVFLNSDSSIKSQVIIETMTDIIFPISSLDVLLENKGKNKTIIQL